MATMGPSMTILARHRFGWWLAAACAALALLVLWSLAVGQFPVRLADVARALWSALTGAASGLAPNVDAVVLQVRAPRIGGALAVGLLGGVLANVLAGSGAQTDVVEKLLGPERAALDPALVASVAGTLQGAMRVVFGVGAAIAVAAFAAVLAFPHVPVAPRPTRAPAPPPTELGPVDRAS